MSMYTIAERLHKLVCEVETMSTSEYMGWLQYLKPHDGNLLSMSEGDMVRGLTGG